MKCTVTQADLKEALATAVRAVSSRGHLAMLSHVLLSAAEDRLTVTGTDLSLHIAVSVAAEVDQAGSVAVPARLLVDYVSVVSGGACSLETRPGEADNHVLSLRSGRSRANIHGLDAADFPPAPDVVESGAIVLAVDDFKRAVTQTVMAASSDEAQDALGGVLFHFGSGEGLTLVATDRHRLSLRRFALEQAIPEHQALVAAKHLQVVAACLRESAGEVSISLSANGNRIFFLQDNLVMSSLLHEGVFPNYVAVIAPLVAQTRVIVGVDEVVRAVKAAAVMARDDARQLHLAIDDVAGTLTVRSGAAQVGDEETVLDAAITGPALEITFNARYLIEALAHVDGSDVAMGFGGPLRAATLNGDDADDQLLLVVPMRPLASVAP